MFSSDAVLSSHPSEFHLLSVRGAVCNCQGSCTVAGFVQTVSGRRASEDEVQAPRGRLELDWRTITGAVVFYGSTWVGG